MSEGLKYQIAYHERQMRRDGARGNRQQAQHHSRKAAELRKRLEKRKESND